MISLKRTIYPDKLCFLDLWLKQDLKSLNSITMALEVVLSNSLWRMRQNCMGTQQTKVKDGRSKVPKMVCWKHSKAGSSRRWARPCSWWLQYRHCKKNSPSVLSCIEEGCDHGIKGRRVHCRRNGEEPVPLHSAETVGIWQKRYLWKRFHFQVQ